MHQKRHADNYIESFQHTPWECRDILANAPIGIFISGPEGWFRDVNPAMAKIFGYESPQKFIESIEDIGRQLYADPDDRKKITRLLEEKEEVLDFECPFLRRDGSLFWASITVRAIRDDRGNIIQYGGFFSEITKCKLADEKLRESEKKYRFLAEEMTDTIWTVGMDMKPTYVSPSSTKNLGFTPEERLNQHLSEMVTPETYSRLMDIFAREMEAISKGDGDPDKTLAVEMEYYHKDGHIVWLENKMQWMRDNNGNIIGIRGISRDITERKSLEQSLKEREATLQAFFDAAHESMVQIDRKGMVILSNTTGAERLGRKKHELVGTCLYNHFPPEVAKFRKEQYEKVVATGNPVYFQDTRLGRTFEQHCYPTFDKSDKVSGVAIFAHEITKRKHAEEALMERELLFRKLSSQVPGMIYQFLRKPDGTYFLPFTSDGIRDIFGCSPEDAREDISVMTRSIMREDLDMFINSIESSAELMTDWRCEYRVKLPGKPVKWLLGQSTPEKQADGSIIWHGFNADITPNKLAEETIKSKDENFRKSMEDSPLGIRIVSKNGETLYVNKAFHDLFECRGIEEAMAFKPSKLYSEKSLREHIIRKERRKEGKKTQENYKIEITARDKTLRHINVWRKRVMWNDNRHYQVLYMDITGQILAEKNLESNLMKVRMALGATVRAVSATVEARDPYTAGHQRRTADLARSIATEMGLSEDHIESIRMAGIIHDVGKISVPSEILSKPTKLTDIEFGLVKAHARTGYNMLKDIEFPWPVARMILEHHERIDGSGYPGGLTGKDMLTESKVLAVADVVEAMASHRPYRPALGIDVALEEIKKNRGILYDADAADACLKLFGEKNYTLRD